MSVDFAVFNLTELAVLDATDAVALPEMGASSGFTEDTDDLISGTLGVETSYCCSSSTCCCC